MISRMSRRLHRHAIAGVLGLLSTMAACPARATDGVSEEGIEAGFERINANGGVDGKRLKLWALDGDYEVDPALANTNWLIEQDKVFALMAFYGTATSTAVMPLSTARACR